MSLISLVDASKDYGLKTLFSNLNLHISAGDRLGIVGENGSGKSTLLKVLAGIEYLETGERLSQKNISINLVTQSKDQINNNNTVIEEVLEGCGDKKNLLLEFHEASNAIYSEPNNKLLLKNLGEISEKMDYAKAWIIEQECKEILSCLGINDLYSPINSLSGGYKKRVHIASSLVSKPDLLLLDEPTNHLDANSIEWLQKWLSIYKGAVVLVTHDRYVLDKVTNSLIEIERGKATLYKGNYSFYLKEKSIKQQRDSSQILKANNMLKKELNWLSKAPKARGSKQKARQKRIIQMTKLYTNDTIKNLEILSSNERLGKVILNAKNIEAKRQKNNSIDLLFSNFNYNFIAKDRVGIIGANGTGKSTLLDIFAGRISPSNGDISIGKTINVGYFDQNLQLFNQFKLNNFRVIDFIEDAAREITIGGIQISASNFLEKFLFTPKQQHSKLNTLSGGESKRLALCRVIMEKPNLLLLDEPTNDLDIYTMRVLEEFLYNFPGCIVIVSHDRYFLDRTVKRIFHLESKELKQYEGNYSDFLLKFKDPKSKKEDTKRKTTNKQRTSHYLKEKKRRNFKESIELKKLEEEIPLLEQKKQLLEKSLQENNPDATTHSKELAALVKILNKAEDRWIELSELDP